MKKTEEIINHNKNLKTSHQKIEEDLKAVTEIKQDSQILTDKLENTNVSLNSSTNKIFENKITQLNQSEGNKYIVLQGDRVNNLINNKKDEEKNILTKVIDYLKCNLNKDEQILKNEVLHVKILCRSKQFLKIELKNSTKKPKLLSAIKKTKKKIKKQKRDSTKNQKYFSSHIGIL